MPLVQKAVKGLTYDFEHKVNTILMIGFNLYLDILHLENSDMIWKMFSLNVFSRLWDEANKK